MKDRRKPGMIGSASNQKSRAVWLGERPQNRAVLSQRWESPEALESAIAAYLAECEATGKPPLYTSVARVAKIDRVTLWGYLGGHHGADLGPEWLGPLKDAVTRCEEAYERRLHEHSCTGAIFGLKQRGWIDTPQPVPAPGGIQITVGLSIGGGGSGNAPATAELGWCDED